MLCMQRQSSRKGSLFQADSFFACLMRRGCGIAVSASRPWSLPACVTGIVAICATLLLLLPLLMLVTVLNTVSEGIAQVLDTLTGATEPLPPPLSCDDEIILVLPGTCTWVFYQIGAVQYLCEHFDLRQVKIAGVSSGAVCAAVILIFERCASAAEVRDRAHELYAAVDALLSPIVGTPASFIGRLGVLLEQLLHDHVPTDADSVEAMLRTDRIRVGLRRWRRWPVPHQHPHVVTNFTSRHDFINAVAASATVGVMVTPWFARSYRGGWCSDGVNPFSFWSAAVYAKQLVSGLARVTAPRHTFNGGCMPWHRLHAMWNVGAMACLLPTHEGRHIWVSPTVSGAIRLHLMLLVSGPWVRKLWCAGYDDTARLDGDGYFQALEPFRRKAEASAGARA